jgi:hypothetical protein
MISKLLHQEGFPHVEKKKCKKAKTRITKPDYKYTFEIMILGKPFKEREKRGLRSKLSSFCSL